VLSSTTSISHAVLQLPALHSTALALGPSWLDPNKLLDQLGTWALWGAVLIVFAECGLFTFFMPGDSLLFTVGLFVGTGGIHQPLWLACLVLTVAAFAGNLVGYEIGRALGPALFRHPDARLLKRQYVDQTVAFFDRYGARAILLARFVPIVRTFITVTAGMGRMDRRRFLTYTGIGGVIWAVGITVLGYFLGSVAFVKANIELIAILIVVISVLPMVFEYLRARRANRDEAARRPDPAPGSAVPGRE
jgi:membrane-associated protein